MTDLVVLAIATWRLSYALHEEYGPWGVLERVRKRFGIEHDDEGPVLYPQGSVFSCVGCLSFWLALLLLGVPRRVLYWPAASAGAILVHLVVEWLKRG